MANQIEQLEATVKGTLAENDFYFDQDKSIVKVPGLFTSWAASTMLLMLAGIAGLLTALVVAFVGPGDIAVAALAVGIAFLALFGWANRRPGFEVRLLRQTVAHKKALLPFNAIRPEYMFLQPGDGEIKLIFRGGGINKELATFRQREEAAALRLRQLFWELFSATDVRGIGTYGSTLTPTQWWIMGTFAVFAEVNGQPLDRFSSDTSAGRALDQVTAKRILASAWSTETADQLLANVESLIAGGHREDFLRSSAVAALPPEARDEHARLLHWVAEQLAAGARFGTGPIDTAMRRLLLLRHGAHGRRHAMAYDAFLAGLRPSPDNPESPVLAEVGHLLVQLSSDPDFWKEELNRVAMLVGQPADLGLNKHMIWDYARAMMLYRWGHQAGWFTEEYCWERMLPLARDIQRHYGSWTEMGGYYLSGRRLWAGGAPDNQDRFEQAFEKLRTDVRSPWNIVDWGHPLHRDW
ncbi:DUF1266 domain-containing protein [Streptomonospora nanhaiensis]|uniref:DUF1266 domain-containing protein n=1 Tax=Streptomonospora nanhaiensis TaxID=1323731 RepID=A0A853BR24_9ACTN|nr:DUF1266 domain-containing protein [Streptomonospora nanhaiensis]MBV2365179.1 DUF1266 domain-containing protein [Streptomonospora nanhaiensis]MBX9387391.1 DUF1266 domain-containing protein [Streptomonospora nanhaiensis]NYI97450.1 hypothetical protein [Streptomonospora nanhaiensis]